MINSTRIIATLKQQLKQQGITYKKLAQALDVSESAVKQMFAGENFRLKRLDEICDVIQVDLLDLVEKAQQDDSKLSQITLKQEATLVKNKKLLAVAYCLVNYWSVTEILDQFDIEHNELLRLLLKLDKMGLIDLLPDNRVRLKVKNNFKWHDNGPIENYFRCHVQNEFFNARFNQENELQIVKNGMISMAGQRQLHQRLKLIDQLFDDISQQEKKLPASQREGVTMILAIRSWQYAAFAELQKD